MVHPEPRLRLSIGRPPGPMQDRGPTHFKVVQTFLYSGHSHSYRDMDEYDASRKLFHPMNNCLLQINKDKLAQEPSSKSGMGKN
ncbi:hypothetical protein YC2023_009697 [Brassica napus]